MIVCGNVMRIFCINNEKTEWDISWIGAQRRKGHDCAFPDQYNCTRIHTHLHPYGERQPNSDTQGGYDGEICPTGLIRSDRA